MDDAPEFVATVGPDGEPVVKLVPPLGSINFMTQVGAGGWVGGGDELGKHVLLVSVSLELQPPWHNPEAIEKSTLNPKLAFFTRPLAWYAAVPRLLHCRH